MHLTEALMAAFEATGDTTYLSMAERIVDLIIRRHTVQNGWQLPEHFTAVWQLDKEYSGDPVFRPYGTTPGRWLEWSRLLLQLWELGGRESGWMQDAAKNLFREGVKHGWNTEEGGFYYTLGFDKLPHIRDRYGGHAARESALQPFSTLLMAMFFTRPGTSGFGTSVRHTSSTGITEAGTLNSTGNSSRIQIHSTESRTSITCCRPASSRSFRPQEV
jgi:uncharacterized protein YyaL (SSP411 family)